MIYYSSIIIDHRDGVEACMGDRIFIINHGDFLSLREWENGEQKI
jgi:hypothetical protein